MIDSAVFFEVFKEASCIMWEVMVIRGSGLGLLIAASIAIDLLSFRLFVKPLQDHFGVCFSFAHDCSNLNWLYLR